MQGPISGLALAAYPTQDSDNRPAHPRVRRHIGTGPRPIMVTHPARTTRRRIARTLHRGRSMKRTTLVFTSFFALILSVAAFGIGATVDTPRTLMSPLDFSQGKKAIEAEARVALAKCRVQDNSARELCKAEVRAEERIKKADLQARYHGTVAAADQAREARAKARYELAKVRCTTGKAEERSECLTAARSERGRAAVGERLASST